MLYVQRLAAYLDYRDALRSTLSDFHADWELVEHRLEMLFWSILKLRLYPVPSIKLVWYPDDLVMYIKGRFHLQQALTTNDNNKSSYAADVIFQINKGKKVIRRG